MPMKAECLESFYGRLPEPVIIFGDYVWVIIAASVMNDIVMDPIIRSCLLPGF